MKGKTNNFQNSLINEKRCETLQRERERERERERVLLDFIGS